MANNTISDDRQYALERNADYARFKWTLRVYGRGVCTLGEGRPCSYNDHDVAERAGRTWVARGIAPADQVPA